MNFGSHEDGFSDDGSNFDFSTFDELLSQTTTHPENDFNSDAPVQSPFITQDFHHPGGPYGLPQIGALQNQAAIASGVGTFDPLNLGVPQPTILALALQRPQQAIVLRPHQVPQTLGINPSTYVNSFGGGFPPSTMTAMPQVAVAPVPGPSQPTTTILSVVRQEEMADLMRDNWPVRTSTGVQFLPKAILSELLGDGIAAHWQVPRQGNWSPIQSPVSSPVSIARSPSGSEFGSLSSGGSTPPNIPGDLWVPKHDNEALLVDISGNFRGCSRCHGAGGRAPGNTRGWSILSLPCIPEVDWPLYRVEHLCNKEWIVLECRVLNKGKLKKTRLYVCNECKFRDGVHRFVCSGKNIKSHQHSERG